MRYLCLVVVLAGISAQGNGNQVKRQASNIIARGVSKEVEKQIVKLHNDYRSEAEPPAAAMQKIYWDVDLAAIAQKYADKCQNSHSTHDSRTSALGRNLTAGENMATGYRTFEDVVRGWHGEKTFFKYGVHVSQTVGHYTQVMRDMTSRIGCGYTECANIGQFYVCNYISGQYDFIKPYVLGSPCQECKKKCSNNLCDCKGRFCYNGGTLDFNTCQCKCTRDGLGPSCLKGEKDEKSQEEKVDTLETNEETPEKSEETKVNIKLKPKVQQEVEVEVAEKDAENLEAQILPKVTPGIEATTKYVDKKVPSPAPCAKKKTVCEFRRKWLSCPTGEKITIQSATYGRSDDDSNCKRPGFNRYFENTNCPGRASDKAIMESDCNGKRLCLVRARNKDFGDPCPGTYKYLTFCYQCK